MEVTLRVQFLCASTAESNKNIAAKQSRGGGVGKCRKPELSLNSLEKMLLIFLLLCFTLVLLVFTILSIAVTISVTTSTFWL